MERDPDGTVRWGEQWALVAFWARSVSVQRVQHKALDGECLRIGARSGRWACTMGIRGWIAAVALIVMASCSIDDLDLSLEPDGSCRWVADCMLLHCPASPAPDPQFEAHADGCLDVCLGLAGRGKDEAGWFWDLWICETGWAPGHSLCADLVDECEG